NELIKQMIEMDMNAFEKTLEMHINTRGIEKTITQIIFSYMEKIGVLWQTNHINPAQEHLVSNIIRQKLIVGIEGIQTPLKSTKSILLFLPEAEYHELGLLFMYYLLKSRGVNVIYLGSNAPLSDVAYVAKLKKPDYIYSHITRPASNFNFEKFLLTVNKNFKDIPFIISGQLTNSYEKKIQPPVIFKRSFSEVMNFISNM
ncbi:MAG: MerR family transcriptional regulator, partial [Ferruginibacter sp.]|nr:MerR family transcriptional regulator [Ferruginibacter sp.]